MKESMTQNQRRQIIGFAGDTVGDTLDEINLSKDGAQWLIETKDVKGNVFKTNLKNITSKLINELINNQTTDPLFAEPSLIKQIVLDNIFSLNKETPLGKKLRIMDYDYDKDEYFPKSTLTGLVTLTITQTKWVATVKKIVKASNQADASAIVNALQKMLMEDPKSLDQYKNRTIIIPVSSVKLAVGGFYFCLLFNWRNNDWFLDDAELNSGWGAGVYVAQLSQSVDKTIYPNRNWQEKDGVAYTLLIAPSGVIYTIAVLKGFLFNNANRDVEGINHEAKKRGFTKSNKEEAFLIRDMFSDKEFKVLSLDCINIMYNSDNGLGLFAKSKSDLGGYLIIYDIKLDRRFDIYSGFAYIVSQTSLPS